MPNGFMGNSSLALFDGFSRRPHTMRNLSREAKNIKHDRYFSHGLARRKTHENFSAHKRKQLS